MYILGISAYYHDSAAVLVKNGIVVCAIEEERFTRIKHDNAFPIHAIRWCLNKGHITIDQVDVISYYEKPLLKFERTIDMFIQTWPKSLMSFVQNMPELLGEKLSVEHTIRKKLGFKKKIVFVPHHLSHAAAAYYSSSFISCAVLTIDGVGEYQTTALWEVNNGSFTLLKDIHFPHSLGLFYSTCAAYLGFKVNEDEYKLMGLAAYGNPKYVSRLKKMVRAMNDGSFNLDMNYFSFRDSSRMWSNKFEELMGKSRPTSGAITPRHADIAKSVQTLTEEVYISIVNHLYTITLSKNICVSGGVALNALANGLIHFQTPFERSHIFGPAGDSGGALGSALYSYYKLQPVAGNHHPVTTLYLGSDYSDAQIEKALKKYKLSYIKLSEKELINQAAQALADGKIIGWFQGKCELGPRALGNRSILCRPSPRLMKTKVNVIKIREQFRPFAGSILQSHVHDYFEVPKRNFYAPFMNFCFTVRPEKRKELAAIVHKDNTCRIQTVNQSNGLYHKLIKRFYALTGTPCVLNTSFNLKGEPIVETPEQAIQDFVKSSLKFLFLNSFIVKQ